MNHRIAIAAAALVAAAGIGARPAVAQMPKSVQEQLERIGYEFGPQTNKATVALYTSELKKRSKADVKAKSDVAYGSHMLQVLDLYRPEGKTGVPVVLFVHGGGFKEGNKIINPELFGNVPSYFARNGVLGVSMNYRLAPAALWPAGAQDVAAAVAWLKEHAVRYGGDPARIFLLGYSAGATHVASYIFDRSLQPAAGSGVAGAIVLSGVYQVHPKYVTNVGDNMKAYFGTDASQYDARSPLTHVPGSNVPVFVAGAEHDPGFLVRHAEELKEALCKRDGRCPRFLQMAHHNHISTAAAFDTSDDELGRAVLEFIREGR